MKTSEIIKWLVQELAAHGDKDIKSLIVQESRGTPVKQDIRLETFDDYEYNG